MIITLLTISSISIVVVFVTVAYFIHRNKQLQHKADASCALRQSREQLQPQPEIRAESDSSRHQVDLIRLQQYTRVIEIRDGFEDLMSESRERTGLVDNSTAAEASDVIKAIKPRLTRRGRDLLFAVVNMRNHVMHTARYFPTEEEHRQFKANLAVIQRETRRRK